MLKNLSAKSVLFACELEEISGLRENVLTTGEELKQGNQRTTASIQDICSFLEHDAAIPEKMKTQLQELKQILDERVK